jgi:C4-dicarboxylate-specific signal transduction histidine kinase
MRVKMPFFTTKDQSVGLGLSFCDVLLQKMGGSLEIRSSAGETSISVTLPKTD